MTAKKETDKNTEEVKKEQAETKQEKTVTYKVLKKKNFVGFVHPDSRRLVTANDKGEFIVKATDEKAIAILENAADVHEV